MSVRQVVMEFSLGIQETFRVSRDVGGPQGSKGSSVGRDPETHNGLVVFRDVACVLSTLHGTDGDTELQKGCPPPKFDPCEVVKEQKKAA